MGARPGLDGGGHTVVPASPSVVGLPLFFCRGCGSGDASLAAS